jgi:hypothetical protein
MPVEASESQPETTRPAKPMKTCLSLVESEQEERIITFRLKLFRIISKIIYLPKMLLT